MTDSWLSMALSVVTGYLLGSVNTAILVSRMLHHTDIRRFGSGNAGMTNMYRVFGKKAALLTALGDLLKAVLAVLAARTVFFLFDTSMGFDPGYFAGLFVLIGHVYPVWFGFRGGKGVLPAVGVILMVDPAAFGVLVAITLPLFLLTKTMSLVSLTGALLLPVVTLVLRLLNQKSPWIELAFTVAYAILVIYSHRTNIRKLLNRTEQPLQSNEGLSDKPSVVDHDSKTK